MSPSGALCAGSCLSSAVRRVSSFSPSTNTSCELCALADFRCRFQVLNRGWLSKSGCVVRVMLIRGDENRSRRRAVRKILSSVHRPKYFKQGSQVDGGFRVSAVAALQDRVEQ